MEQTDFLNQIGIFLNFFSFGSLLAVVFTSFIGIFILTLPNKERSTLHLGLTFLFFGFFSSGYFISAFYYDTFAANHRYLTAGWIGPAFLHLTQWTLRFPENKFPRFTRALWIAQWTVWICLMAAFVYITQQSGYKYHFTAHYWDFDAEFISKIVSYFIILYLVIFLGLSTWRAFALSGKQRWAILGIAISTFIGATVPSATNTLSRDGVIDRGLFLISLVFFMVLAFFLIYIIYINTTKDRTTFMAKIVAVSLVTFLMVLLGLGYFFTNDKEEQFDNLAVAYSERALEGGKINEHIQYIAAVNMEENEFKLGHVKDSYILQKNGDRIDFEILKGEFLNTAFYEKVEDLKATGNFESQVKDAMAEMPHSFDGYRSAINSFFESYNGPEENKKDAFLSHIDSLNQLTFVESNRISYLRDSVFREDLKGYLEGTPGEFEPFKTAILDFVSRSNLENHELKNAVQRFIRPVKPEATRHYRKSRNGNTHYVAYSFFNREANTVYETGYSYIEYRQYMHPSARTQTLMLGGVLIGVLLVFPLFFRGTLVNPLNELLSGVKEVNKGDLSIKVPVHVQDEIGFLATSFNGMVRSIREARDKLQDYAANLEDMVKERTAELNETLEQVQKLKTQQDGDYFLTSLLAKPLNFDANKSETITTEIFVEQKKQFEFRNKHADLGGDICVTGNLRLGKPDNYRRYSVGLNGDAMGKSMQGAGGALVMGVVINSIMARSAKNDKVLDMTPEEWLTDLYEELQGVFLAFNGSMAISAVVNVIDDETGQMWYFNAEHPYQILYRGGKATFIEEEMQLRKIGLESDLPFQVYQFQMQPGDVIIAGSDGRDDIDLTPDAEIRTINEDEFKILETVEKAGGDLSKIRQIVGEQGNLTDDFSLLKIGYKVVESESPSETQPAAKPAASGDKGSAKSFFERSDKEKVIIEIDTDEEYEDEIEKSSVTAREPSGGESGEFEELYKKGKELAKNGQNEEALELLEKAYEIRKDVPGLNKIIAVLTFKSKDYNKAVQVLETYLEQNPDIEDFWLYLSIAHKRTGDFQKALEAADKVFEINPERIPNLIQLSDLHMKLGNTGRARIFAEQALQIDENNAQALTLLESLKSKAAAEQK